MCHPDVSCRAGRVRGRRGVSVTARHSRPMPTKGKAAFMQIRLLAMPRHRGPGLGDHQRRQGAGAGSDAAGDVRGLRPLDRSRDAALQREGAAERRTSPTCTIIWRRSRSRRTTRPFRCSASSGSGAELKSLRSNPEAFALRTVKSVLLACFNQFHSARSFDLFLKT